MLYDDCMNRTERMQIFCSGILSWYSVHKRTLPWRDLTTKDFDHKAYLVLVSEVMLQQTQVSRVVILYKQFVQKFPRIEDLAEASNAEVLIAWRGLGYNSRALRLRDTARIISAHTPHPNPLPRGEGKLARKSPIVRHEYFPRSMEELQKLPGIGHYTAGAIRNFAFGIPTPCIDVNIRRILHRFFVGPENEDGTWKKDDAYLHSLAGEALRVITCTGESKVGNEGKVSKVGDLFLLAPTMPSAWHSALMDFGSLVCTKNSPKWDLFPEDLRLCCKAYGKDIARNPRIQKKEPGRMMAGKFVPNRIFRGRIIEALRDAKKGLTLDEIGARIAIDWTMQDHRVWLGNVLRSLLCDHMIVKNSAHYRLSE